MIYPEVPSSLYRSDFEHDACGVGFIANMHGKASYDIIDRAVAGLKNLAHRGAIDADSITGDGAGMLTQIPVALLKDYLESQGRPLYEDSDLGVGVVFLPRDDEYAQAHGKRIIEEAVKKEGLAFLVWREVPVDPSCLGQKAMVSQPLILQALVARKGSINDDEYERSLLMVQKTSMRRASEARIQDFYICSFSHRTVVYKGLLNAPQVRKFFIDLKNPKFTSSFAVFHQRYSTNTFPTWHLAQPFRMMAHNGEINTIRGNRNLMRAREYSSYHGVWGDRYLDLSPLILPKMSDSASFDNALQVISLGGRSSLHAVAMMMPSAWEKTEGMDKDLFDFYRYHSCVLEPWDGPAAIAFADGRYIGASLDRNGLRPARYKVYEDGTVILSSEAGIIPEWGSKVVQNGRLGPGRMIAVDLQEQKLLEDEEIKKSLAQQKNFGAWCEEHILNLHELTKDAAEFSARSTDTSEQVPMQAVFGYDSDEEELVQTPMAATGKEPIASMGDDTPLAVLSHRPRLLYTYFKQLFAQVTNPAIDSIRERAVMSLNMYLGGRLPLFEEMPQSMALLELESPILFDHEFAAISEQECFKDKVEVISGIFPASEGTSGIEKSVKRVAAAAERAVREQGARVLILSDRGVDAEHVALPMLLFVGAVHRKLVSSGLRLDCDIVCETGEAREVHQFATLLGFGANAIHPYLAFDVVRSLFEAQKLEGIEDVGTAIQNYRKASDYGLYKIMAKMGISTLFSYQGAQIFEALGLSKQVIDECFVGTPSPIGGIGYEHIGKELFMRHAAAYPDGEPAAALESEGYYKVNRKGGEFHAWNSKVVSGLNRYFKSGKDEDFEKFLKESDEHQPVAIKDLLKMRFAGNPIPLEEVESAESIRKRFTTAAMSLGALSPEAHECLAIAMNRIGGKSNSGEGGEDPKRFVPMENGDTANSAIKQVASGRFGVTAEYLSNAKEIEIKVSQGAKPGEGGQLPGHKVSKLIATLRFSVPGVTLISPPPHHDIYSIEDLAQLIYDLKQVNPRAKVCVKLVSCSGVGTVAAGVAKAYADVILISGHDGGTGASPIASIKNAGSDWAIGIAEAQQVLMMNDLRERVVLRTDGGMKSGRDIVIAALLGAEEYNFGTAALLAAGCAMFRVCHLNSCPVGVATQREDLRAKFRGKPENVVSFFNGVAEDVRRYLARLGFRSMDEVIGRSDLLEQIDDINNDKTRAINLGGLLHNPDPSNIKARIHTRERNDRFGSEGLIDEFIIQDAKAVINKKWNYYKRSFPVTNIQRNIGTRLSGEIAYIMGNKGLAPRSIDLTFTGSAGQAFGTFLVQGVRLNLIGEGNDYVGKGMNGGEIIIHPKEGESFVWKDQIILGNTCLYGATGGHLFAAGRAGERFGVRNSGATAVVEGLGDHACEYMTGGLVVCLGPTGANFGAGMSGGMAFIYDEEDRFKAKLNPELVAAERIADEGELDSLRKTIEVHLQLTGSPHAKALLEDWDAAAKKFWKVAPKPAGDEPVEWSLDFEEKLGSVVV